MSQAWSIEQVPGEPRLRGEVLSQTNKQTNTKRKKKEKRRKRQERTGKGREGKSEKNRENEQGTSWLISWNSTPSVAPGQFSYHNQVSNLG